MSGEHDLSGLFEDLEQQAQGLRLADRDAEVADRARAEYAAGVDLAARMHASFGRPVALAVRGVGSLEGTVTSAGPDWCLLAAAGGGEWLVRLAAITLGRGLSERAVVERARPVSGRLGFGSALRRLAEAHTPAAVHGIDGARVRGRVARVGFDFFELRVDDDGSALPGGEVAVVPMAHVAAVRSD